MPNKLPKNTRGKAKYLKFNQLDSKQVIKKPAYAVLFEEEENGRLLKIFISLKKANNFVKMFWKWVREELTYEESVPYEICYFRSRQYSINTSNCFTKYLRGCYLISNGKQTIKIMNIDLSTFDFNEFAYERKMYCTCFGNETIEKLPELYQVLLYKIIKN